MERLESVMILMLQLQISLAGSFHVITGLHEFFLFKKFIISNFSIRSPWPMINILRTPQVRAAQKGVPTGQVYIQNEQKLTAVGADKLQVSIALLFCILISKCNYVL
jgi:hypothetical protein